MSDDLVERLREAAGEVDIELVNTAADEIDRLEATQTQLIKNCDGWAQKAAAAEAEVVKLREAIKRLRSEAVWGKDPDSYTISRPLYLDLCDALTETKDTDNGQ